MDWFLFAIGAAFSFSIYSVLIRFVLKNGGDSKVFAALLNGTIGVSLLVYSLLTNTRVDLSLIVVSLLLTASVFFAFSSTMLTTARQAEEVSRVSIVRQAALIWIFIGGVFLFGEEVTIQSIGGLLLLLLGNILVLWENNRFRWSNGLWLVLFATFFAGGDALISKYVTTNYISPSLFIGIVNSLAAVWIMLVIPNSIARLKNEIRLHTYKPFLVALFMGGSFLLVLHGYQVGPISKVYPVFSISIVLSVLAAMVVLKERTAIHLKLLGSVIALCGIILLRFFSN